MIWLASALAGQVQVDAGLDREILRVGAVEERYLVVEIQAPEQVSRQNVHLALVMDSSDSMYVAGKLDFARDAASALATQLGAGDTLSVVSFDTDAELHLRQGPVTNPARVRYLLDMLTTGGGTNLFGGMTAGLEELRTAIGGVRRMVVLSDGQATVGPTGTSQLAQVASDARKEGLSVSTLGLGLEFDRKTLMAIADAGGGLYGYVNEADGVADLFTHELDKAAHLAASGVTVDFEPTAGVELLQVYGYEAWDGESTGRGWHALVGDVHAGESRKVVIKLRIDPAVTQLGTVVVHGGAAEERFLINAVRSADEPAIRASVVQGRANKVGMVLTGSGMATSVEFNDRGLGVEGDRELSKTLEALDDLHEELGFDFEDQKTMLKQSQSASPTRAAMDDISFRALGYME